MFMLIMFPHGKNMGPMIYNKDHGSSYLKKHIFHEHVEEGKEWDLLAQKDQGDGNQINKKHIKKNKEHPSFSNH